MDLPLQTEDQVRTYLREALPGDNRYLIGRMPVGAWLLQPVPTPEEEATGAAIGMSCLVVNADTGVILQYPSWPGSMVLDDYTEAVTNDRNPSARQIYPRQTRIELLRIAEDPDHIEYRVGVRSELKPPEQFSMVIDKSTRLPQPTTSDAMVGAAWAGWRQEQDGTWPEMGTTEY
ncbi:hypothetical protein [Nocardia carnea]|uniref:hypothetical protein n=1 Tax=Nocardia carnea TaxID=37328 RepID=UPI00245911B6|nr:hypothetical protein [Nocardia carnea]